MLRLLISSACQSASKEQGMDRDKCSSRIIFWERFIKFIEVISYWNSLDLPPMASFSAPPMVQILDQLAPPGVSPLYLVLVSLTISTLPNSGSWTNKGLIISCSSFALYIFFALTQFHNFSILFVLATIMYLPFFKVF